MHVCAFLNVSYIVCVCVFVCVLLFCASFANTHAPHRRLQEVLQRVDARTAREGQNVELLHKFRKQTLRRLQALQDVAPEDDDILGVCVRVCVCVWRCAICVCMFFLVCLPLSLQPEVKIIPSLFPQSTSHSSPTRLISTSIRWHGKLQIPQKLDPSQKLPKL